MSERVTDCPHIARGELPLYSIVDHFRDEHPNAFRERRRLCAYCTGQLEAVWVLCFKQPTERP